ncbi:MAG: hypothetical protein ACOCXG_02580 [Nanoarchaeota archaeon]
MRLKNKNGGLAAEGIIFILGIVFIFIFMLVTSFVAQNANSTFEEKSLPEISQDFPSVFVSTFLRLELKGEEIVMLNLNPENKYRIIDVIHLKSQNAVSIIKKYEKDFVLKYKDIKTSSGENVYDFYREYSGDSFDDDEVLNVYETQDLALIESLSFKDEVENENFFVVFKTENNKFRIVSFKPLETLRGEQI